MAVSFRQWESDPLFSAAEVVQDSADRMDSLFHIFLHEQSLAQGSPTDQHLVLAMDHHRRDLTTAIGTTKWQLEDFDRAVNLSVYSDRSNMREDVISRHKQFIRAIEEQVFQVERSLQNLSAGTSESSTHWMNLNEKDRDGLASFLSGGYHENHFTQREEDSNILRRFLDPTKSSEFDKKSDEIIELTTEEVEEPHVTGVMHIDRSIDNLKNSTLRKVGSSYYTQPGFETSISIEDGHNELGGWGPESSDSNAKSVFSKNRLRGSRGRLDVLGFLSNVWSVYGGKMARAFEKRQNVKRMGKDFDQNHSAPFIDVSQTEQGIFKNMMQSCSWATDCRRGQQWKSKSNLFFLIVCAVLITLFFVE